MATCREMPRSAGFALDHFCTLKAGTAVPLLSFYQPWRESVLLSFYLYSLWFGWHTLCVISAHQSADDRWCHLTHVRRPGGKVMQQGGSPSRLVFDFGCLRILQTALPLSVSWLLPWYMRMLQRSSKFLSLTWLSFIPGKCTNDKQGKIHTL